MGLLWNTVTGQYMGSGRGPCYWVGDCSFTVENLLKVGSRIKGVGAGLAIGMNCKGTRHCGPSWNTLDAITGLETFIQGRITQDELHSSIMVNKRVVSGACIVVVL